MKVGILSKMHIKAGLSLQEDDHLIELHHEVDGVIAQWSTVGILSKDEIIREATKYIEEHRQ